MPAHYQSVLARSRRNLLDVLFVNIDTSGFGDLGGDLEKALKEEAIAANRELALMAQAKATEMANERLHNRRKKFIDALHLSQEGDVWVLSLDAGARWIDEGMPPHNMLDDLLASPKVKRAADGSAYVVVPFEHGPGKGSGENTPYQQDIVDTLKKEFKARKIPWAKIEKGDNGAPKLGKIRSFSIDHSPVKSHDGPGQGRGPIGDVRQGPNKRQVVGGGPAGGGIPFLQGVAVYQRAKEGGGVQKSVMTFRIASSKHQGQDRWNHPGLEPTNIMDDVAKWAQEAVERDIFPKLIDAVLSRL
jgi:hypothetical protein